MNETRGVEMIHSVPAAGEPTGCHTVARLPRPDLRDRVLGYGGFRPATGRPVRHWLLPLTLTTLIIDFDQTIVGTHE